MLGIYRHTQLDSKGREQAPIVIDNASLKSLRLHQLRSGGIP